MNEQEMLQEIERLRRELAAMSKSRNRLCDWLCQTIKLEPMTMEEQEDMQHARFLPVDVLLQGILPADMHHLIDDSSDSRKNGTVVNHA